MDWKHGYFADSGYTYGFYPETTPMRLAWIAAIQGYRASLEKFRYLDLGCGQGLSLIHMAALHPDSEFVGIDFMPEHIAHGRHLAKLAGLKNVSFIEGDFIELADCHHTLGEFDYAVAHGITTWISDAVRSALFTLAGRTLKPGGLMYNSYNTYPGWLPAAPFQNLVLQLQTRYNGKQALEIAQKTMASMKQSGGALFDVLPTLQTRLDNMSQLDPAYLVQEYNNQYWQPVYSSQMLNLARQHKLEFISSATLPEVFEGCYPKPILDLINSESDAVLKETIRDLCLGQSFRRDIYIKGGLRTWPIEKLNCIGAYHFITSEIALMPGQDKFFEIKGGALNINGKQEVYGKVLSEFGQKPTSFSEVLIRHPSENIGALAQIVSLLVHGGWLAIAGSADNEIAKKLNNVQADAVLIGAPYRNLSAPLLTTAPTVNDGDFILIALINKHGISTQLSKQLLESLRKLNRRLAKDGVAVNNEQESSANAELVVKQFLETRYKKYQKIGAI